MAAAVQQQLSPHDDLAYEAEMLRLSPVNTPPPGQETELSYRCPVSTPANFVHPSPRVRRTKPMPISLEISLTAVSPGKRSAGGKPTRAGGVTHRSLSQHSGRGKTAAGNRGGSSKVPVGLGSAAQRGGMGIPNPINNRTLDYYYVDKAEEQREEENVNTFWLRTLCAQPVHEILDKYRRRTELRRTRLIWTKTYTTPGERSLLRAWERNAQRDLLPPARGFPASADTQHVRQIYSHKSASEKNSFPNQRRYRSEPAASNKSGVFYSEDGESDEEGSQAHPPASTVSGNVSVSTGRYSLDQRSYTMPVSSPDKPALNLQYQQKQQEINDSEQPQQIHQQQQQRSSPSEEPVSRPPLPNYAMSDHFRVSLPAVDNKKWTRDKGTPTVRKKELRSSWNDVKRETSDPGGALKTRRSANSSTTQPRTPRSSGRQNHLPSI